MPDQTGQPKHPRHKKSTRQPAKGWVPLETYLRHRRIKRIATWLLLPLALITLSTADHKGWLFTPADDWTRYHDQLVHVVKVVDGDTIVITTSSNPPGPTSSHERVRFWGIDTPELARPDRGRDAEPYAHQATQLTRQLCEGKTVRLHLQRHQLRDRFDRLLAYVILQDGRTLNEQLITAGLARVDDRFSHDHNARYIILGRQAKVSKKGIWAPR